MQELYQQLKEFGHVKLNEPLSKHTTFKIGGKAQFFVIVEETEKLIGLLDYLSGEGINYYILGGGSNLLFSDNEFEGVVIKVKSIKYKVESDVIEVEAGVVLAKLLNEATHNELTGLEWAAGVPGTVGGAVRGNAGAMGHDMAEVVEKVEVWRNGEVIELNKAECGFSYRESAFKKNTDVILRVWSKLAKGDKAEILKLVQGYLKQRTGRYPNSPSAGSFFKNIDLKNWPGNIKELPELFQVRGKVPAGWLIEQAGMKGFSVGGAKVSDEHGNFIISFDSATQHDILTLIESLKEKVYNKYGVELEPEVEVVH